jgi:hypothetical protein
MKLLFVDERRLIPEETCCVMKNAGYEMSDWTKFDEVCQKTRN